VTRACVILDLYAGFWEGQRLGAADYVLSADEKSIQVLARLHPGLPPAPGQVRRVEFEYKRLGTVAYHAAWDVFRGRLFGRVAPTTSIATLTELIDLVMGQLPYQAAERVFWIVDERKVLTPLDVATEEALTQRLLDFQDYYQERAQPFSWKCTTADLKKRLEAVQEFSLQAGFTLKTSEIEV
jgi:hypothetical protein